MTGTVDYGELLFTRQERSPPTLKDRVFVAVIGVLLSTLVTYLAVLQLGPEGVYVLIPCVAVFVVILYIQLKIDIPVYQVYENGLVVTRRSGEQKFSYINDVVGFGYYGFEQRILGVVRGVSGQRLMIFLKSGKPIELSSKLYSDGPSTRGLDWLLGRLNEIIRPRMLSEIESGKTIPWTRGWKMSLRGIETPNGDRIGWASIRKMWIENATCRISTNGRLLDYQIETGLSKNFMPGYEIALMLKRRSSEQA